jgi:hypothetical protein
MTRTRVELVTKALKDLGAVGAGQAPSAEDQQTINETVEPVLADLAQRDIYHFGDINSIEDEAFMHLAKYLANENARSFGMERDPVRKLEAERDLRALQSIVLSGQSQVVEYF